MNLYHIAPILYLQVELCKQQDRQSEMNRKLKIDL